MGPTTLTLVDATSMHGDQRRAATGPGDIQAPDQPQPKQLAIGSQHRPDIDGLRAVAVLPVLFYHAGVPGFSGGFVGVDIFFVISGYLITGILVRDAERGRLSIAEFYRRRILRIFPALFAMAIVVSALAWATMLPAELTRFARSLAAAGLFVSNFHFYAEAGYFDLAGATKPLLHTWSLAVEEQWYILWPLAILFISARRLALLRWLTAALILLSFVISVALVSVDASAAFYLLPARAWELGLGALLAIVRLPPLGRVVREVLAAAGILMILVPVKMYTYDTPFPGLAALPPCLGAVLLIATGATGTTIGRVLSLLPLQFVGWISYSLYLWHWPIAVFAETGLFLTPGLLVSAGVVVLSFVCATLSWRFVERPFRQGVAGWPTRRVLLGGGLAIAGLAALALISPMSNRMLNPLTPHQTELARYVDLDGDALYRRNLCFKVGPRSNFDATTCLKAEGDRPTLLLLGDSHAAHLWPGLSKHGDRFQTLQATVTGCAPKLYPRSSGGYCESMINGILRDWLPSQRIAVTLLASRWTWRKLKGLEETLRDPIVRAANPVLVGPMPEYSTALPRLLVAAEQREDPGLIPRSMASEPFMIDAHLREIAHRTGTPYISLIQAACKDRVCRTLTVGGAPFQFDATHLSAEGSVVLIENILPEILDAMQPKR